MKQKTNEYDDTKRMLSIIRKIQNKNQHGIIKEQEDVDTLFQDDNEISTTTSSNDDGSEDTDINVINSVEVIIHGDDETDMEIKPDEKTKISQVIDSFRTEVSEIAEFGKLHIYDTEARLDGKIGEMNLNFMLSAGDESGVFLTNLSSLEITDETLSMITKLKNFGLKFTNGINDVILTRRDT